MLIILNRLLMNFELQQLQIQALNKKKNFKSVYFTFNLLQNVSFRRYIINITNEFNCLNMIICITKI